MSFVSSALSLSTCHLYLLICPLIMMSFCVSWFAPFDLSFYFSFLTCPLIIMSFVSWLVSFDLSFVPFDLSFDMSVAVVSSDLSFSSCHLYLLTCPLICRLIPLTYLYRLVICTVWLSLCYVLCVLTCLFQHVICTFWLSLCTLGMSFCVLCLASFDLSLAPLGLSFDLFFAHFRPFPSTFWRASGFRSPFYTSVVSFDYPLPPSTSPHT